MFNKLPFVILNKSSIDTPWLIANVFINLKPNLIP